MRNYIILNGVNSNTITGLLISTLPPITKPKIRTQTEEIDGRDGDIVTKLGYSAYDKEIEIGLYGNFDINEVIAYFNTEGTIVFSNEADKYYNYQILDQIDYEKLIRFKTAKVKMHVQPFKYPLEETPVEINIQNVTGAGETISLDNTAEAPVTLALKGNTSQDGTPTPEAPVEVNTVTGRQEINVVGKNLFNKDNVILGKVWNGAGNTKRAYGYIKAVQNQRYTVSCQNNNSDLSIYVVETTVVGSAETPIRQVPVETSLSFTPQANTKYIIIQFATTSNDMTQETVDNSMLQIEKGSEATAYEPYQSQSYELDLGKNLYNANDTTYYGSCTYVSGANTNQYKIKATGTDIIINSQVASGSSYSSGSGTLIPCKYGETIYYDIGNSNFTKNFITQYNSNKVSLGFANTGSSSGSYTPTNSACEYISIRIGYGSATSGTEYTIAPIISKSSNLDYAPYKTPIELCKIGDYQDYIYKDNNKWYIKREIKKVIFDGSEDWSTRTGGTTYAYALSDVFDKYRTTGLCNYFQFIEGGASGSQTLECIASANTNGSVNVFTNNSSLNTLANYKTWLGNNNVTVYYVLEDPEDEEITDNTLIGQLNAIENARSYDTTTHINQNTPNKPFIINATAVQKGTDTGTVDNIGNIYAKPTIDIEGSGIVEIYLDGNQIFNVDLSTINECVIDTTNLEAYNPATTQLMNRQVTGDYSNFKINVGDNQVKVSGAVTKATISNYTRWI